MSDLVLVDDIAIQQGDDRPVTWRLATSDGSPVTNFTGYSVLAQVRPKPSSATVLHEWSTTAGNAVLSESSVILTMTDSESWTWRRGVYDLHLIDPVGTTQVVARGEVTVIPAVTR